MSKRTKTITLEQLLTKGTKTSNGCIEWDGYKCPEGYGVLSVQGKKVKAHRLAATLAYGQPQKNHRALHSCDNRPCINPEHLRWGTAKENYQDMIDRNRTNYASGERHGKTKLTNADVLQIRELGKQGVSQTEIAKRYNMSQAGIWLILQHINWKNV
jgi:hypothetical protein